MKTRTFILAAATGMTLAASALAADSFGDSMWTDLIANRQTASGQSAPARHDSQPERTGGATQPITGADFDHQTQSISRSLQRSDLPIAGDSGAVTRDAGVAGSAGVVMGPDRQPRDTGSARFDDYVEQVNGRLRLDEPAFE